MNRRCGPWLPPTSCLCTLHFIEKKCEGCWCLDFSTGACRRQDCFIILAAFLWRCPFLFQTLMPVRLPVFINLMLLGYCLLPGLSERKLPEKISCGVQTVAPSLFSLLKKSKFSNTCIVRLNIKALVRVWGERGQNYRVSRKG